MWLFSLQQRDINSCFLAEKETVITWNHFELHSTLLKAWKAYTNSHQAWIQTSTEKTTEFCAVMVKQLAPYLCYYLGTRFSKAHCNDSILVLCNLSKELYISRQREIVNVRVRLSRRHAWQTSAKQFDMNCGNKYCNTSPEAVSAQEAICMMWPPKNTKRQWQALAMQSAHNSTVWHMTW